MIWDDKKDTQIINDIKNKNISSLIFNTNFKSLNSLRIDYNSDISGQFKLRRNLRDVPTKFENFI